MSPRMPIDQQSWQQNSSLQPIKTDPSPPSALSHLAIELNSSPFVLYFPRYWDCASAAMPEDLTSRTGQSHVEPLNTWPWMGLGWAKTSAKRAIMTIGKNQSIVQPK